jgi:hypothetical protein
MVRWIENHALTLNLLDELSESISLGTSESILMSSLRMFGRCCERRECGAKNFAASIPLGLTLLTLFALD